jgi:hypothetical protein
MNLWSVGGVFKEGNARNPVIRGDRSRTPTVEGAASDGAARAARWKDGVA